MDENFRKQRVEIFLVNIEISYVKSSGSFSEYLGVNVVEELKLLDEEDWDNICNNIVVPMKLIQRRKL